MRRLLIWWTRFCQAWRYASSPQTDSPQLIEAKAALAQFLAEAADKREAIAREWARAIKRHQTLEAETKFRCDRMLAKLDKRSQEVADERLRSEAERLLDGTPRMDQQS